MKAYKLLKLRKNGAISSLFINNKEILPLNKWMQAKSYPTDGFAIRPGWHTMKKPVAPHLSKKNRVWAEVEIEDFYELKRPEKQGNIWYVAKKMKILKLYHTIPMKNGVYGIYDRYNK